LDRVRDFPPVLSPSIVTLSAPDKLINPVETASAPVIVLAPDGVMLIDVYDAEPEPLATRPAEDVSVVSPTTLMAITP